ncbi:siderophore biosynthesis protein [Rhizobium rhizosphaerae]|uniref:Siderophore biosynthesis protein n=1 Tax=Xaviernesmea rhizosphaerae TaxID=1672749 RepID=A0A1Q9ADH9_9HYPH|nr:AMP-binding protein [Xaviernesmea rhizosphaerae]OLP52979.1 siderophore biosynthesis protein [Xaviernesmea rhizosphaerae]
MHNRLTTTVPDLKEDGFLSIVQYLEKRAALCEGAPTMRFFHDDAASIADGRFDGWSWAELRDRSQAVAMTLRRQGFVTAGARILVVYPPGLGFVAAFFGCLYAGTVPVPVPAPRRADGIRRWLHIARDAGIAGIVCAPELAEPLEPLMRAIGHGFCLSPPAADATQPRPAGEEPLAPAPLGPRQVAFLQYTSGSTSDPKGVMVTHGNLIANLAQISRAFRYSDNDRSACWLPHYHDMGLIDGLLSPVFNGFPVALMAPAAFLRRPLRFLELASHVRATVIGGPNFAYEHCAEKAAPDAMPGLDLSAIRIAYNGAEPIRPKTLKRFAAAFAPHGFSWDAFYCCYGQAEATLFQTGGAPQEPPRILAVDRQALVGEGRAVAARLAEGIAEGVAMELAGCGQPAEGLDLAFVDPERGARVAEGEVGEIWIRGPNVTPGYWGRARLNAESFDQTLDGTGGWRRTGDLGFMLDGQIYITGRLKDLIIIRGQNHHPEDIEQSVFSSHPALAQGRAGVFAIEIEEEEQVGVVCELTREGLRDLDAPAVIDAVRAAVSRHHHLKAAVIALLRPSSLPRTPSGKVRRFACRQGLIDGDLRIVARWDAQPGQMFAPARSEVGPGWQQRLAEMQPARRRQMLRTLLQEDVAHLARLDPGRLPDASAGFFDLGLDSVALVTLGATIERELGLPLRPTLIFEYPTIARLADHLHALLEAEVDPPAEEALPRPVPPPAQSAIAAELAALKALLGSGRAG